MRKSVHSGAACGTQFQRRRSLLNRKVRGEISSPTASSPGSTKSMRMTSQCLMSPQWPRCATLVQRQLLRWGRAVTLHEAHLRGARTIQPSSSGRRCAKTRSVAASLNTPLAAARFGCSVSLRSLTEHRTKPSCRATCWQRAFMSGAEAFFHQTTQSSFSCATCFTPCSRVARRSSGSSTDASIFASTASFHESCGSCCATAKRREGGTS